MNDNKVQVTIITSNKSGILSSIMLNSHKLGLTYRRNQLTKLDNDKSSMVISFVGKLNCTEAHFIKLMESHTEIHSVENIEIHKESNSTKVYSSPEETSEVENTHSLIIRAHDNITPKSLQIAEDRLTALLGPVASMLVESAASETKHIGDLFFLLAEELDDSEKHEFLSIVSGL